MKTFLKVILPVLAFTLASAAAVETKAAKAEKAKNAVLITGYIQNPSPLNCDPIEVDCSTTFSSEACMTSEATPRHVWEKNEANACNVTLYKVLN